LLAPFTPFLSDTIYRNLTKESSVHLAEWPRPMPQGTAGNKIVEEMEAVREIAEKVHSIRKELKIPVRQPLSSYSTTHKAVSKDIDYLLKDEVNIKNIKWEAKEDKLDITITFELEEEAKARDLLRKIQEERKSLGLNLTQRVDVKNAWIPKDTKLVQWISKKAQIANLRSGKFKVTRSS
ncbi:MAG TPA: class I tRNA ligase family protein, partial [Patescibacteria group bacterium]|nr:class I tRNA ligase family protein [Patescibacteria group bacterium]